MGHIVVTASFLIRREPFFPHIRLTDGNQRQFPAQHPADCATQNDRFTFRLTSENVKADGIVR